MILYDFYMILYVFSFFLFLNIFLENIVFYFFLFIFHFPDRRLPAPAGKMKNEKEQNLKTKNFKKQKIKNGIKNLD